MNLQRNRRTSVNSVCREEYSDDLEIDGAVQDATTPLASEVIDPMIQEDWYIIELVGDREGRTTTRRFFFLATLRSDITLNRR